ncbi:MAG: hypothetical protein ACNI25_09055 [Halarcobacter sp.]
MKKMYLFLLLSSSFLLADSLELKEGWNLIGIPSTDSASILSNNSNIEKATGGGEGNTNAFTYLKSINYSRGDFLLGQAYWVKSLNNTTLTYTKSSVPTKIALKQGWNLIYPFETIQASDLANYPEVEKATGGGVGNTSSFTYLKSINYSRGESLPNQGYWIKATANFDMIFKMFDYRAWGIGGDEIASKASLRVNGLPYTVFIYSTQNIDQSNANSSGEFTLFQGTMLSKTVSAIQINADYFNQEVVLKVFEGETTFDNTTFIAQSDIFTANNDVVNFGNLTFVNPNDYSVPTPTDTSIEMPPSSPVF